jgi:hypothetical protein
MSIREENELLVSLAQQSNKLRCALDDLNGVWSDAASRTLHSMHLSSHLEHDEHMLQALEAQTELHFKGDGWIDAVNQHMTEADTAHKLLQGHLQYAQQQMVEAERKCQDSQLLQQEVRDMLPKIQQPIREAK